MTISKELEKMQEKLCSAREGLSGEDIYTT